MQVANPHIHFDERFGKSKNCPTEVRFLRLSLHYEQVQVELEGDSDLFRLFVEKLQIVPADQMRIVVAVLQFAARWQYLHMHSWRLAIPFVAGRSLEPQLMSKT
ncbi:hypothetical protein D0C28_15365 [Rhizobium sp. AU243]|nr:hypothetical protein D0C28_15365 [Rhizobium sp. AU243]